MNKIILLFLISFSFTKAQTIKGTISDSIGIVPFANVVIKEKNNSIIQYVISDEKGFYKIQLKKYKDSLQIEVSTLIHETKKFDLKNIKFNDNESTLDFFLKERIINLDEVILKKTAPIVQKKDTLEYNPESFKDGSEKVVEDLLKKLPGIKVEENGEIKYKGKTIKRMLLDGDDLFDTNYTIGSKNINVNMIEKIQGIEHYEENSLLKGIKDSDDVAINLVLKKGKTDFSGTSTIGYGIKERYFGTVSGILINKKVKSFGVTSFNNIGQNPTPYDFSSEIISVNRLKEINLNSKSIINEGNFNSLLDNNFHNQNNTFYTSLNSLNKVFKNSIFKINLGIYLDELNRLNKTYSTIFSGNETIEINEFNSMQKKPKLYDFNIHFSNKEKDRFHWEYLSKVNQNTTSFYDTSSNNLLIQNSEVQSERFSFNQNLNSTYKISENKALVSSLLFSKSKSPQDLTINPGTPIDDLGLLIASNQSSEFQKQFLSFNSSFYLNKDKFKYAINTSIFAIKNDLKSSLSNNDNQNLGNQFINNYDYSCRNFNINPVGVYNTKKYSLKIGINAIYNKIRFEDELTNMKEEDFFLNPKITVIYKLHNHSNAIFNYSFNQLLPEEDKMFTGIIQSSYRNFLSNQLSLEYLKTHSYNLTYNYKNFLNLSQFSVSLNHDFRPNNYFLNTTVNQNISVSNHFFANVGNKEYGINITGEKYFHPLRTTFQLNSSFNFSSDNDIINESDFRGVVNKNIFLNFTARRGINKRFVVENKFFYTNSNFKVEKESLNNNLQMITNQTKIVFKSKNYFNSNLVANFIAPNLKSNINYFFLDYEINYTPNNKSITYSLIGKNLTNNKEFTTKNISDFSVNHSSHNLIERYVMFKLSFGF